MNKVYKFQDIIEAQYFLNGAIVGNAPPKNSQGPSGYYGLIGLTLIFTAPTAGTVTFVAAADQADIDPNILQLQDIKAQVQAVMGGVTVTTVNRKITFVETTPTHGVTLANTGTANGILGFDINIPSVGKYYAPPGTSPLAAPAWTWAYSVNENMHVVFTLE